MFALDTPQSPLPMGTQSRIQSIGETSWSDPFQAAPYWSPADIAALGDPSPIRSQTIGELTMDSESHLWASTLGGGLLRIHTGRKEITHFGHFEGLPSQTVISVDAQDNRLLVGTSDGAVLFEDGKATRFWNDELPHPYTQSVRIVGDSYWLGTYEGLYIDTPQGTSVPLSPFFHLFHRTPDPSGSGCGLSRASKGHRRSECHHMARQPKLPCL